MLIGKYEKVHLTKGQKGKRKGEVIKAPKTPR